MEKFNGIFLRVCLSAIPIIGIGWILAVTDYFGVALTFQQVIAVVLAVVVTALPPQVRGVLVLSRDFGHGLHQRLVQLA